jgi:hypothetical protein
MESDHDFRSDLFTITLVTPLLCILWSMLSIWFHEMNEAVFQDDEDD